MTFYDWTLRFASEHPFLFFVGLCCAYYAFRAPFYYAFMAWNRHKRSQNIAAKGWPTNPKMDADGDIVKEEE